MWVASEEVIKYLTVALIPPDKRRTSINPMEVANGGDADRALAMRVEDLRSDPINDKKENERNTN